MLSSNVLVGALAFIVAGVNAGPCRPTTSAGTTLDITSTATSAATTIVIESTATEVASTTIESSTVETSLTSLLIETNTVTTVATSAIESTTALAATTTTIVSEPADPCNTADDCVFQPECLDGLLNICVCANAVCVVQGQQPPAVDCSTDQDCISADACPLGPSNCFCIDLICQQII